MNFIKRINILFTIVWGIVILILIAFPMPEFEGTVETFYDKIVHFIIFGIFAYSLILVFKKDFNYTLNKSYLYGFLGGVSYSLFAEFLQIFVPGRDVSEYDLLAGVLGSLMSVFLAYLFLSSPQKPKMLLHICCIGCGVFVSEELSKNFRLTLYFYNSNIFPENEFNKRLEEIEKIARKNKINIIIENYDHDLWLKKIKGLEAEPEGGKRCDICYKDRLEKTAKKAKFLGFQYFTSTLSLSPHKNFSKILRIGKELEEEYKLNFFDEDFKKNDGFKKSCQLSRELDLYRQDYCGCEFSLAETKARRARKNNND